MSKHPDQDGKEEVESQSNAAGKAARPQAEGEDERSDKGFERVPGPGPKDAGKGAAGPEAKERLDRNH